jgi:phage terminase large subunit-like protein|tara:strand:- start:19057 stop:20343 length:1287 start_codon:yes stop_codon:yes gene_type:complete
MAETIKIDDKRLQEKIGWTPHEDQNPVLRAIEKLRIVVLCAGRRWGKSALCAYIALRVLVQPNKKIWIVSPTYDLSLKVFNYLVRWFGVVAPSQLKGVVYRPYPKIQTATGSVVECKSAENPKSLLGEELDLLIVDEAAQIDRRIWEQFLFPTTSSRQGKTIFISTPLGKNWFNDRYVEADANGGAFRFESRSNPYFPKGEWERAEEMLPKHVFQQEYQADFLDDASAVFRGVYDIIRDGIERDSEKGHFYTIGVDLAKYRDYTVLTVMDRSINSVVHIDRFNEIGWNIQKARIIALAKRYNNARLVIDSTGVGDPISEDLRRAGILVDDFKYSGKSKLQLIEKLTIWIEQGNIFIPAYRPLLDELDHFGYILTDKGHFSYGAPTGKHDDCVNSLALSVWTLIGKGRQESLLKKTMKEGARKKRNSFV